jgi:1-acyl-sn-glycerol-3-phosphate acyltransferase
MYAIVWLIHFLILRPLVRVKISGKENLPKKGRVILAANHQNFFDGFLMVYPLGPFKRVSFLIAKRSLPSLSVFIARSIGFAVIGNEIEDYQRALKKLNKILSHGGWVGIFPEGDVSPRNIPRRFKGGVAKLSVDSRTKVVPIYLSGTYNLRHFKYLLKRPEVSLKIGKPVDLYSYSSEFGNNLDGMAGLLRERVLELADLKLEEKEQNKKTNKISSLKKNISVLDSVNIS